MAKAVIHIWHNLETDKVLNIFRTDPEKGLSLKQVQERQAEGKNKLPEEKPISKASVFVHQMRSPLIYILMIAGFITLGLKEFTDTIVIFSAVFINTIVGYLQELKAGNALKQLKKVLKVNANVLRNNKELEIEQEELVCGDIVFLKTGSKVPADIRILESWNLKIREAALTGEWLGSDKEPEILPEKTAMADRDNMAYMGTIVEQGEGKGIVVSIGKKTELGKVAKMIKDSKEEKTPYQKKLARFSKSIGIVISLMALIIFIQGMVRFENLPFAERFHEMFTTAVAVAVAAIPEGLPIAMTVILATGMQGILKEKGLVRKLASAETLGSTSIIATDKTLTLTQGKMEVSAIKTKDKKLALEISALANHAFVENPEANIANWKVKGDPTSKALLLYSASKNIKKHKLEKEFPKISEIPFTTDNKFIAGLFQQKNSNTLYVAGAPEKLIQLSSKLKGKSKNTKITVKTAINLTKDLDELTSKGLRVIAVAYKRIPKKQEIKNLENEVKDLIFVGFIGLRDPLRKDAKKAFALCRKAGMRPIIVTGDHLLTAKAVAKELNLKTNQENVLLGREMDKLTDKELSDKLNKIDVFARVEPKHKLRIIQLWQAKNHVVAMTGDGINDAPALKKADIGVALGSGTDVAKEVSDLVLLNDNFSIIVSAIEHGRAILDNIRKVITYLLSGTFSEIILIGFSVLAGLPLPVTAVQILWVNLIEDGFPSIALAFEKKEKDLMSQKPAPHDMPLLTKEMKVIIFIIGILTNFLVFGLFLFLSKKFGIENLTYIRTMIFAAITIDSLFYVFSCKSLRKNIWNINIFSNKYLIGSWIFGFLALVAALYIPFLQNLLHTVSLNTNDWLILIAVGIVNLLSIEGAKYYFIARHQTNK